MEVIKRYKNHLMSIILRGNKEELWLFNPKKILFEFSKQKKEAFRNLIESTQKTIQVDTLKEVRAKKGLNHIN